MTFICGPAKDTRGVIHTHERVVEITDWCRGRSAPVAAPVPPPRPLLPVAPPVPARVHTRAASAVPKGGAWRSDPVTDDQVDYVARLGGNVPAAQRMTKGQCSDYIDSLISKGAVAVPKIEPAPEAPKSAPVDDAMMGLIQLIKDGRYATRASDSEPLVFYRISRPMKGQFKGAFKVQTQHSEKWTLAYVVWPSKRESVYRTDIKTHLLMLVGNQEVAASTYAWELGQCQICGRKLTLERSRYYGIGAECEDSHPSVIEAIELTFGPYTPGKTRTALV